MTTPKPEIWKVKFCRRVAGLREQRGWTQETMAAALDVPLARYKKYERRSPLPPHLLARFALLAGVDIAHLLAVDKPIDKPARHNSSKSA